MSASKLLDEIVSAGMTVRVDGADLVVSPRSKITDELRASIRAFKPGLIALLSPTGIETPVNVPSVVERKPRKPRKKPELYSEQAGLVLNQLADDKFAIAWQSWLEHRREIKKPVTKHAADLQLRRLRELGDTRAIALIEYTIERGWQGLHEDLLPADRWSKESVMSGGFNLDGTPNPKGLWTQSGKYAGPMCDALGNPDPNGAFGFGGYAGGIFNPHDNPAFYGTNNPPDIGPHKRPPTDDEKKEAEGKLRDLVERR